MIVQMKTWSVALVLCLNIGVDPPDVVKTNPCARKECWIGKKRILQLSPLLFVSLCFIAEPLSMSPQKALEQIGNQLQKQYERWQPRARYKQLLDPTTDDVRKLCVALRKNAKVIRMYSGSVVCTMKGFFSSDDDGPLMIVI